MGVSTDTGVSMTTEATTADDIKIDEIVEKYIKLRDESDRIAARAKADLEPVAAAMKGIETYLMALAQKTGQTKFGTKAGTAFITTKTGCNVGDWDTALGFIREQNAWHLLNKAVNKTAVGEYMEANQGQTPPGVEWVALKAIQIRRS